MIGKRKKEMIRVKIEFDKEKAMGKIRKILEGSEWRCVVFQKDTSFMDILKR